VNLDVGVVLAESVDGPDGGREPADQGDLQDEAHDAGEGSANGKKRQPGKDESDYESQVKASLPICIFAYDIACDAMTCR
jgi:hypothetical protein